MIPSLHLTAVSNLFPSKLELDRLSRRETVSHSISAPISFLTGHQQTAQWPCFGQKKGEERRNRDLDEIKHWKSCLWIKWMVLVGPEQINAGLDAKWPGLLFCPKKWLRHTSKPCLSPLQIFNPKMRRASSALPTPTRIYKDKEHTSRKKLWESFSSVGLTLHFYNCLHFNTALWKSAWASKTRTQKANFWAVFFTAYEVTWLCRSWTHYFTWNCIILTVKLLTKALQLEKSLCTAMKASLF